MFVTVIPGGMPNRHE